MSESVAATVFRIVADQARRPVEEITANATPEDLGLDSLNLVEMVFAIEEAFDIRIPFSAQDQEGRGFDVSTVGQVIEGVRALVGERAP